jgi:hypothetical protein
MEICEILLKNVRNKSQSQIIANVVYDHDEFIDACFV